MSLNIENIFRLLPVKLIGRFLQTDISYLARGTFWLTLGKLVNVGVSFSLSILYAHYLLKETYGDYRYVLSILGTLGIFAVPGMITAIRRSVSRGYDKVFLRGTRIIFTFSFGITVSSIIIGSYFLVQGNTALGFSFIITSILIPFVEGLATWRGYLESKQEFRKKTVLNIATHIIYGISMISAVIYIHFFNIPPALQVVMLLGMYFASQAIPNIFLYIKTAKEIPRDAQEEPGAVKYGMRLSIVNIPTTIANYIDGLLLYNLLGPAALAVYSFAIVPTEQMKAFLGNISNAAFPKLSLNTEHTEKLEEVKESLPRKALRASLITGGIVLLYILVAPYFYKFLFPRYLESATFSQVFALSLIFFPFSIFNAALKAEGNIKKIYIYQIGAPVIQIIALFVLIPLMGIWGAVAGKMIGRLSNYFLPYMLFNK